MASPALAMQAALVTALRALNTEAGQHVYDNPPATDPFPRITFGPWQAIPLFMMAQCGDATEHFVQIDVWSRASGTPEAKRIGDAIRARLHDGALTLSGHTVELMIVESENYAEDPDGLTTHGRVLLRVVTQPIQ